MARTVAYAPRDPEAVLYGSWKNAFVGGSHEFLRNGARLLDARTQFHYLATVITPAMAHARSGPARRTRTPCTTPTATCSTAPRPTGCTSTRIRRRRTSGRSTSTTPRPARCFRSHRRPTLRSPATPAPSKPTTTAPTISTSGPMHPRARSRTGSKPSPEVVVPALPALRPAGTWFDQTWKLNEFEPIG